MSATGKTLRLTTAQAIVRYLQVQSSERDGMSGRLIPACFGIFGHGNVAGLGQALHESGARLPYHQPRNEQAMVHTACGFARASRRLATLACTSSIGPGSTNLVTGAATATVNRLPVLLLPADYYAGRHQGPVLQQLEHPISADASVNDCLRPVSRFFDRIQRAEQLLTALPEAMRVLVDPADTGAVTLSLPQDVQPEAYDFPAHFFEPRTWTVERRAPDRRRIRDAVELLKRARRPLLICGGGVFYSEAEREVASLARQAGIPVAETYAGKGTVVEADGFVHLGGIGIAGTAAAAAVAREADLVIAVGTRLTDCVTASRSAFQHPEVRFVNVNVCARDACKEGAVPVTADARTGLRALLRAARSAGIRPRVGYGRRTRARRGQWDREVARTVTLAEDDGLTQARVARALDESVRRGDTVLSAAGTQLAAAHALCGSRGQFYHLEFGYSCMGHELPAGLGVRMVRPWSEVFVYLGDGTYLMSPTELVTALQERLKVTVVLAENHGFQSIWHLQQATTGRDFGNEFRARSRGSGRLDGDYLPLDLAANAASLGACTWRVQTVGELRRALAEARLESRTCVIVAEVEPHADLPASGLWWDIPVAQASGDAVTRKLRAEDDRRRQSQRFHY